MATIAKKTAEGMKAEKAGRSRPTIAFLTRSFSSYQVSFPLWFGLCDAAREADINLISFPGNPPHSQFSNEAPANILYDLVTPRRIDGVIIWSGVLSGFSAQEHVDALYRRFASFPRLTIGPSIEGITGFTIDNYRGMYDACSHLVERHRCRRVAFIRGPATNHEAELRYRAYQDVLRDHGLPFIPELVHDGNFVREAGCQAVAAFLGRREGMDAVAAANDHMAMGAIEELFARGIKVPEEVRVVGFDDIEEVRFAKLPLSTVRQPFYEMGRMAVGKIMEILQGDAGVEQILVPTEFIARPSCGCHGAAARTPDVLPARSSAESGTDGGRGLEKEALTGSLLAAFSRTGLTPATIALLVDAFLRDSEGREEGVFASALVRELVGVESDAQAAVFQDFITELRAAVLAVAASDEGRLKRAEDIFHEGRLAVSEFLQRFVYSQGFRRDNINRQLRTLTQQLASSYDIGDFLRTMAENVFSLGVPACYLSFYDDPSGPPRTARLALASADGRVIELNPRGRPYPAEELIPEGVFPRDRRIVMIVDALYFDREHLGFVAFEQGPRESGLYNALQVQLSAALRGIRHARDLEILSEELARSNRELEQFAFIASHDLKEPLRKLSLFADRLDVECAAALGQPGREYLARIRNNARRMQALINDLIEYSQMTEQARTPVPVDLSGIVQDISSALESDLARAGAALEQDGLPVIEGEPNQLYWLFHHLIDNAIKFRAPHRAPRIRISAAEKLFRNRAAHEVTVEDNGIGIEERHYELIFKVFQRLAPSPLDDGTGIGLTICRRIVDRLGGDIRVESVFGKGSKFIVTLPRYQH